MCKRFAAVDTVALIFTAENDERKLPLLLPLCENQGFQSPLQIPARRGCGEQCQRTRSNTRHSLQQQGRKPGAPSSHMTHRGYGVTWQCLKSLFKATGNIDFSDQRPAAAWPWSPEEDLRCFGEQIRIRGSFTPSHFHRETRQDRLL